MKGENRIIMRKHAYIKKYINIILLLGLTCILSLILTGCSESATRVKTLQVQNDDFESTIENLNIGDTLILGRWFLEGKLEKRDVYWTVLDKNEEGVLLLNKNVLKEESYSYDGENVTWKESGIRKYWNETGIDHLFSEKEKRHIAWTTVENNDNPEYGTDGGEETRDRLFLLSLDEVNKYFLDEESRRVKSSGNAEHSDGWWWLRTPGINEHSAVYVFEDGRIILEGLDVDEYKNIGPRLAMWLMKEERVDCYGPAQMEYAEVSEAEVGDFVLYGHYEQDGEESTEEPIEWLVLSREDDKLLLISRYVLEEMKFGTLEYWKDSEIREWLNAEFYEGAFNDAEKENIQRMKTSNETSDLLFCLSSEEARGLFKADGERIASITDYLEVKEFRDFDGYGDWWTRSVSTAKNGSGVVFVDVEGVVQSTGMNPSAPKEYTYSDIGVRPALCISLSDTETDALNMSVFGYDSNHDLDNEPMIKSEKNNSSSSNSGKCPNCGGSGMAKYYYGSSDLEAYLSGHDSYEVRECPMCHGTGE